MTDILKSAFMFTAFAGMAAFFGAAAVVVVAAFGGPGEPAVYELALR